VWLRNTLAAPYNFLNARGATNMSQTRRLFEHQRKPLAGDECLAYARHVRDLCTWMAARLTKLLKGSIIILIGYSKGELDAAAEITDPSAVGLWASLENDDELTRRGRYPAGALSHLPAVWPEGED
jgi:hypothetical protein